MHNGFETSWPCYSPTRQKINKTNPFRMTEQSETVTKPTKRYLCIPRYCLKPVSHIKQWAKSREDGYVGQTIERSEGTIEAKGTRTIGCPHFGKISIS